MLKVLNGIFKLVPGRIKLKDCYETLFPYVSKMDFSTKNVLHESEKLPAVKSFDEIPYVKSLPFVGTKWNYFPLIGQYDPHRRHKTAMKMYLQHGKICREDISSSFKSVHVFDPRDIEEVFRHEGRYPHRHVLKSLKFFADYTKDSNITNGLTVMQGAEWHNIRKKFQRSLLQPATVQKYVLEMDFAAKELVNKIGFVMNNNGEVSQYEAQLQAWALESIFCVAFDTKLDGLVKDFKIGSEEVIQNVKDIIDSIYKLEFSAFKIWRFFPTPARNKLIKCSDFIGTISYKYLHQVLREVENSPDKIRQTSFLANMLTDENLKTGDIIGIIRNMIIAGVDSTSFSSAFVQYFLAKHQDCQQAVYEEISRILPNPADPVTVEALNQCQYLKACVKESMRLLPVVHALSRILQEDVVLSGYRIPAGVTLNLENSVACRLEENFSEPLKFKPERWLRGQPENKHHAFLFLPFGFGPRMCIGKRVAEQELWTLLIRILQKYRLEYHGEDINMKTKLFSQPDKPMKLKFIER